MKWLLLLVFGCAAFLSPRAALGQGNVAKQKDAVLPALIVADFEMSGKKDDLSGELLGNLVTAWLSKNYPVVDRTQLKKVLGEQALSLTGLVDPAQAVKAGKLVGAKLVVAGKVFRLKDNTVVVVRVVSVETSRFKGVTASMPGEFALDKLAEQTAQELLKALPGLRAELTAAAPPGTPMQEAPVAKVPFPQATVAVLNFANTGQGDSAWDWLGKGLADLTIGDLASQELSAASRCRRWCKNCPSRRSSRIPRASLPCSRRSAASTAAIESSRGKPSSTPRS